MIDLGQEYDSMLIKRTGLHINAALDAVNRLEMLARMGDDAGALASCRVAEEALWKVSTVAARLMLAEPE